MRLQNSSGDSVEFDSRIAATLFTISPSVLDVGDISLEVMTRMCCCCNEFASHGGEFVKLLSVPELGELMRFSATVRAVSIEKCCLDRIVQHLLGLGEAQLAIELAAVKTFPPLEEAAMRRAAH